jgi:hypothetical protein
VKQHGVSSSLPDTIKEERNAVFSIARQFIGHVIPGVLKPLRVLWNEVIGFVFLSIGVIAAFSTYRRMARFKGDMNDLITIAVAGFFVILMLGFGVSSFLRARKINRSS